MKKLLNTIAFTTIAFSNMCIAQLNEGGKPASFEKHFTSTKSIVFETMPTFDLSALQAEDAVNDQNKGPYRFGFNHFVNLNLTNSGVWTTLPNGDRLWQLGVQSAGASSINLAFDDYYLPVGAKLFIYTADKKYVIGAFTNKNNQDDKAFATDLIPSEAIVIEYYEPSAVTNQGRLNLFRVTHGYRGYKDYLSSRSFGSSGACQINVNCPLGTAWQDDKRSLVCLVSGGSEFCTGALVNDVPQDGKPYVLTANHCGSSGFNTWVFRFNWEASGCPNPGSSPASMSLSGGIQRAAFAGSDVSLVEITGGLSGGQIPASYSPYFAGWSNIDVPATTAMGIHHPSGDIKKISEAATPTISDTYGGTPANSHWKAIWTGAACTEPGSSGSPLFDQNHRIVGQLHGGPSACGAPPASMNDLYGKFSLSWLGGGTPNTQLKPWLDPGNTGATTLNGYDPNALPPAFVRDAGIQSITTPANGSSSCNTSITPEVVLRNYGSAVLTSCTINYRVDFGAVATYNWTGSLNTNAAASVTLPVINGLSVASHVFKAYTTNPNGNTEQNTPNDTANSTFSVITAAPIVVLPQTQDFESTFPSTNWTIGNPNSDDTWGKVTTAGGFGLSPASAMIDNFTNDFTGTSDYIYSSYIDLTNISPPISLAFDLAYARYSSSLFDSLKVKATTDCAITWTELYSKGSTILATAPDQTPLFVPTSSQWRTETVDLSAYAGQGAVKIAIENKSGYGQTLYVDNINVTSATSVSENDLLSSFIIYPNPSSGVFNLILNSNEAKNTKIRVFNIVGAEVKNIPSNQLTSNGFAIDLSNQANGVYFIEVNADNSVTTKKVTLLK